MAELFNTAFAEPAQDGSFAPKAKVQVVGLPVLQVYPESVGMGVGFSVILDAPFDIAREHAEKALGKPLGKCETRRRHAHLRAGDRQRSGPSR